MLMSIKEHALWALFRGLLPFLLVFLLVLFRVARELLLALPELREEIREEKRLVQEAKDLLNPRHPRTP